MHGLWTRLHDDRLLWGLLGVGLVLRTGVQAFYTPAIFSYYGGDSARYLRLEAGGVTGLFEDVAQPAGYPAFLDAMYAISSWLPLTIFFQHLLGLAAAALLYFAVRRSGGPRWAAFLPAAVVALSGDQLFLEHGILTEALWIPVLAMSMFFFAAALRAENVLPWLAAAGAVLIISSLMRNVSMALLPLLAIWAATAIPARPKVRLRNALAVVLPGLLVLSAYLAVAESSADGRSGLAENDGFSLYARTAQFADCDEFSPPRGTESLCIEQPAAERPGPFYWAWSQESPLRAKFQVDINDSHDQELLEKFGKAAILNQPTAYTAAVVSDFARFFAPEVGEGRPDNGVTPRFMSFGNTTPVSQATSLDETAAIYATKYGGIDGGEANHGARSLFGSYQTIFRVNGLLGLALIALTLAGVGLGRNSIRAGAALFLIGGLTLLVIPPAVSSYDVRYAVPPFELFAAGAALGLAALAERLGLRSAAARNSS